MKHYRASELKPLGEHKYQANLTITNITEQDVSKTFYMTVKEASADGADSLNQIGSSR